MHIEDELMKRIKQESLNSPVLHYGLMAGEKYSVPPLELMMRLVLMLNENLVRNRSQLLELAKQTGFVPINFREDQTK